MDFLLNNFSSCKTCRIVVDFYMNTINNLLHFSCAYKLTNLYTPLLRGSKFLTQFSDNGIEAGVGSIPENVDITTDADDVGIEADPVTEVVDTTGVEKDNDCVLVTLALDGCIVGVWIMTVEVDITVVLDMLTESYPVGGHSSGE